MRELNILHAEGCTDELLARLAHEIRSPLAAICHSAQVLKLVAPDDPQQQRAREVIERQAQHLTVRLDELVDISHLSRRQMTLHREPVDICEVIARALEVSRALVLARQHTLAISFADEAVIVEGDLARLTQAVSKLVNNAAEYTDKGGHIWLDARREEHVAVITVRDDGMGISADLLPHVFDLFAPVDSSPGRSNHGLSLGLTLARQLVELHDGAVNVRSSGPGQGSEFAVRLPLLNSSAATTVIAQPLANEAGGPSLRILLIEDLNDVAEMLAFLLTCSGHDVRIANNGQAALELADTFGPQIVISDIGLPGMSGHEVARRLRERPAFRSTPLIALSGYGRAEDRQRSMDAGFDRHLVKPVDPEALERLVRSFPPSAM